MKYMGQKTKMLPVLGQILSHYSQNSETIADPFCGSAAVSWYLAENTDKRIISGDIQSFAVARAAAVIERTEPFNATRMTREWFKRANTLIDQVASHMPNGRNSISIDWTYHSKIKRSVNQSRNFCNKVLPVVFSNFSQSWPISRAYGGYYFSPLQALIFDALRQTLPRGDGRKIALAALVEATSLAAASPGHTAQPFQPTETSAKYIIEAWNRDPWTLIRNSVKEISPKTANKMGNASVGEFSSTIKDLKSGDLVFADPPYSGVHYSRFYHVLETITRGLEFEPEGRGRYPEISQRPSSSFSKKTTSKSAAIDLINTCSEKNIGLIITFPKSNASNGLSAKDFLGYGKTKFSKTYYEVVNTKFSTLGGNNKNRGARQDCDEMIICLEP